MSQQRDNPLPVMLPRPRYQQLPGGGICVAAPAKINLDLLVGPRRADGYHPLDSIVAKVSLYDEITLTPRDDGQITLACGNADCGPAEMNLAYRAAQLLARDAGLGNRSMGVSPMSLTGVSPVDSAGTNDQHGRDGRATHGQDARATGNAGFHTRSKSSNARATVGVDIALVKHIPPGKGLGGGSSDAAAVLAGLDQLWRLATPADRLAELAATLGSDVPLFLGPPAARMTGRGEKLRPLAVHSFAAVLHMPDFACATADVYRAFDRLPSAAGALTGALPTSPARAGRPMATREQIDLAAAPPSAWRASLRNDLTAAAGAVSEQLRQTLRLLRACAAAPVSMTGSGSAMFIICDTVAEAQAVARRLPPDMPGQTVIVLPNPW
jgi:4-diphosphocytidyl-2-C-methyl-D-erythritol kinase